MTIKHYTDRVIPPRYWSVAATLLGNYEEGDFEYGDTWLDRLLDDLFDECYQGIPMPQEWTLRYEFWD